MLDGVYTKDTRLLHNPIQKLLAKLPVIVIELCEHLIGAHTHASCESSSVIIERLISTDQSDLLARGAADLIAL